jgi:hypothetical protein
MAAPAAASRSAAAASPFCFFVDEKLKQLNRIDLY